MRIVEILGLAIAMLLIPTLIHSGVRSLDSIYEILDRRARSPYAEVSWAGVGVAVVVLVGWHVWLGRLSYFVVLEPAASRDDARVEGRKVSWGRILGRVVIPLLLLFLGMTFAWKIAHGVVSPKDVVVRNTVDMQEGIGQLYGL